MTWQLYLALSFAMFMEYAIWGAWFPVLAARLLGPLKMTGKQTGWIYATLPLACIVSPLLAGQLADKYFNAEWILTISHLLGAVLLFIAARKTSFKALFVVMLFYSIFYAATLPLVNSVMFHQLGKVYTDEAAVDAASGKIFLWAPVAWALAGYFLTGWRWKFKTEVQGRDCLFLAAALSLIMGLGCILLPATPPTPAEAQAPLVKTIQMLGDGNFLLFVVISMIIAGLMQFYFQGTARFMQDIGIASKNVPGSMAIAQVVQAIATFFALGVLLGSLGYKWTLVVGAACWLVLYLIYLLERPWWLIILTQSLHGLAYVFFIIAGQIFTKSVASKEILSTMQALIFAATTGVGLLLGTRVAGVIMDKFKKEEKFQWRQIFLVPAAIALVCILVFAIFFKS
ncbi:MAG: MFS transporter [Sedimentisphaerales bacterium]